MKYIDDLLHGTGLDESKPAFIRMSTRKLSSRMDDGSLGDPTKYRKVVSSFQYLTLT